MPQVSIFDTHHKVSIVYSCLRLATHTPKAVALATCCVHDASKRYEPLPLIEDAAVTAHADRVSEEETSYYSLYPATQSITEHALQQVQHDYSAPGLVQDMALIINTVGDTTLSMLMIREDDGRTRLIIERVTKHKTKDEDFETASVHIFDITVRPFDLISEQWMVDIGDLLFRKTDRAVRHFACQATQQQMPMLTPRWKARRRPVIDKCLPGHTLRLTVAELGDDQKTSICCTENNDDVSVRPTRLPCDLRHIVCWDCLLKWCFDQGPNEASCPHCRGKLFKDSTILRFLVFGTINEGRTYTYDNHFAPYENAERVMADIDHELAEYNHAPIKVNRHELMFAFWEVHISLGLEPERSTPYHLQPNRMPEFGLLRDAVLVVVARHRDMTLHISQLYRRIFIAYTSNVVKVFKQGTMVTAGFVDPGPLPKPILPRGFKEYAERTINRMLQFWYLRQCSEPCPQRGKMHLHGERKYWC